MRDLAELISLCAQARADGVDGDGVAWAATCALLGRGGLDDARAALRERGDPSRWSDSPGRPQATTPSSRALPLHDVARLV